jgi:hypothetical protein
VEPPFNTPQFKNFPSFNVQFQSLKVNNLSVKLPPFKIFLSLLFKSTVPRRNLNSGFIVKKKYVNCFLLSNEL